MSTTVPELAANWEETKGSSRALRRRAAAAAAFFRMGWLTAMSYPLSFAVSQATSVVPVVVYYFISRLVVPTRGVAGDYFTFIVIGVAIERLLTGGLSGLGDELESSIREGRLETLLIQPVDWKLLPLGLAEWPMVWGLINAVVMAVISVALGAQFRVAGLPGAVLIAVLGVGATLAVGIVACSIKILAKRTDPLLTVYALAAAILSGAFYPLTLLPPGLRTLSWFIPDTYVISGVRHLLMFGGEHTPGPGPWTSVAVLAPFDLVAIPVGLWLFGRALEYGRTVGVLAGY
jgi:ABC-2 type transport system permease protein